MSTVVEPAATDTSENVPVFSRADADRWVEQNLYRPAWADGESSGVGGLVEQKVTRLKTHGEAIQSLAGVGNAALAEAALAIVGQDIGCPKSYLAESIYHALCTHLRSERPRYGATSFSGRRPRKRKKLRDVVKTQYGSTEEYESAVRRHLRSEPEQVTIQDLDWLLNGVKQSEVIGHVTWSPWGDDQNEIVEGPTADDDDLDAEVKKQEILQRCCLDDRDRQIFLQRLNRKTDTEIARALGITRQTVAARGNKIAERVVAEVFAKSDADQLFAPAKVARVLRSLGITPPSTGPGVGE